MADSMFPPREFSTPEKSIKIRVTKCITKRFVFDGPKIDALKEKAASANSPKPTRVEAVSGLIWRGVIKASNKSNPNMIRPSVWTFAMNLRPRFTPPIPDNYAGNLVVVMTPEVEEEIELKELVDMIKRGRQEFVENYIKKVEGKNVIEAICELSKKFREMALSDKVDLFISSAWCRFRFYDADFGWGRPTWLSTLSTNIRNFCILLDTKDGEGIETWITLSEEDMFWFESDEQILQFAQLNPSVTF
ncbi:HXXXD-type acyl-transferase family protein [Euphorbia peplus]|nr:HXXXD-type acyl-transferase family protein [Euphorbia peplus]